MRFPSPKGLATIALLKARLDKSQDYIGLFMPFVTDAIANIGKTNFIISDVQQKIQERHNIAIPQHSIAILLKRLSKDRKIKYDSKHYVNLGKVKPSGVQLKKQANERNNNLLADQFIEFSKDNNFDIESRDKALELIINFLEDNKVSFLLEFNDADHTSSLLSAEENKIIAEFIQSIVFVDSKLKEILKSILEGLVVYNTATLEDVSYANRKLKGLNVFLDSQFLFQLLGYENDAQKNLANETIELLRKNDVQLLVFDKTVYEMQRILKFYEVNIGTSYGIRKISRNLMGRYFISNNYKQSDIRQISALLIENLTKIGISTKQTPQRKPEFTFDEKKLAEILSDKTKDNINEEEPRVVHDVNCAAAILTLRGHNRSTNLVLTKYIFATSSFQVVNNVTTWYRNEEKATVGPFIHVRILTNIAWLKKPELSTNLKLHELITLCQSILRPSREVWKMFIEHLDKLERENKITSKESVAIVVSDLTESKLGELEPDATISSVDEIINEVKANYRREADYKVEKFKSESDLKVTEILRDLEEANQREKRANQKALKIQNRLEKKAEKWVKNVSLGLSIFLHLILIVTALLFIFTLTVTFSIVGILLFIATTLNFLISWFGDVSYINNIRNKLEGFLSPYIRKLIGAEENLNQRYLSLFDYDNEED